MSANRLYFGDCLDVMRDDIPTESVDLIYLDPPFNSKRLYNAFIGGAQWVAFDDTWRWHEAIEDFDHVAGQPRYKGIMEGLRLMLGEGPQLAYLSYMANRLLECRRVLKDTGSIYLHCDPTMSHYLKAVMDALFGRGNFRNEIVWHYDGPQRPSRRNFGTKHDILLRYSKMDSYKVNALEIIPSQELTASELASYKRHVDGRYYYDLPPGDYTEASIERLRTEGRIRTTANGKIRVMYFLDTDDHGNHYRAKQRHDVWDDIPSVGQAGGKQSLGYPTQKPLALLERIIKASSNEGDLIMDPFCGCGQPSMHHKT